MPDSPTIYLPLQVAKALALARCDDPARYGIDKVLVKVGDGTDYAQVVPADDQSRPNKDAGMNAKLLKSTGLITEWLTGEMEAKPTGYGYKKRAGSAFGRSLTWSHSSPLAPVRFDLPKDAEYLYEAATVVVMPMRLG